MTEAERNQLREEETVRREVCHELRRKRRPQLILMMVIWTAVLTALALLRRTP
jgi:hypothetical protein